MSVSPLSNVTSATMQYYNRMPSPYDEYGNVIPSDPSSPYGGPNCGSFAESGEYSGVGPVYGPSTPTAYPQFVEMPEGKQKQAAKEQAGHEQPQPPAQNARERSDSQSYDAAPTSPYQSAANAPHPDLEYLHQQMVQYQMQYYQMQAAYYNAQQQSSHSPYGNSPVQHAPSPIAPAHAHHHSVGPAEPCRCIYCDQAAAGGATEESAPAPSSPTMKEPLPIEEQHIAEEAQQQPVAPVAPVSQPAVTPKRQMRQKNNAVPEAPQAETPVRKQQEQQRNENTPTPNRRGNQKNARAGQTPMRNRDGPKPQHILTVEGHFNRLNRCLSAFPMCMGDFVVFEGDRGFDIGRVIEMRDVSDSTEKMMHSIRPAEDSEVEEWRSSTLEDGHTAADICGTTVEDMGLPLTIVDAVYQADRNKLTFYYDSTERVDFRRLLSEMFNRFRCRIWMERVPQKGE